MTHNYFKGVFAAFLVLVSCAASHSEPPKGAPFGVGGIERIEGVRFFPECPDGRVKLDLYFNPKNLKKTKPCVLMIHGGSWMGGSEKEHEHFAEFLTRNGYLVASTTYRFIPANHPEAFVEDVKHALYWLRKNAKTYGGNPDKIGVVGGSAGGHLALLLAFSSNGRLFGDVFSDGTKDNVQAVIGLAPVSSFIKDNRYMQVPGAEKSRAEKLSPIYYLDKSAPPMLLIHSKNDGIVPASDSKDVERECKKLGLKCKAVYFDSDSHAFWLSPEDLKQKTWKLSLDFFNSVLKR